MISSHPKANQLLQTSDGVIAYELQRKKRKTLGLYIHQDGVVVRAPLWVKQSVIDAFLYEKQGWLFKKVKEQKQKKKTVSSIQWRQGDVHQYFGLPMTIHINPTAGKSKVVLHGQCLIIDLQISSQQNGSLPEQVKIGRLVQAWQKKVALSYFEQQVKHYAPKMNVMPQRIALTSAKTRWGSANTKGSIRLHWRLLELPHEVVDYVIVHELAHLKEMNHSIKFWYEVEKVVPNHQQIRKNLKNTVLPLWVA